MACEPDSRSNFLYGLKKVLLYLFIYLIYSIHLHLYSWNIVDFDIKQQTSSYINLNKSTQT